MGDYFNLERAYTERRIHIVKLQEEQTDVLQEITTEQGRVQPMADPSGRVLERNDAVVMSSDGASCVELNRAAS